jgi:hypothetical protein
MLEKQLFLPMKDAFTAHHNNFTQFSVAMRFNASEIM